MLFTYDDMYEKQQIAADTVVVVVAAAVAVYNSFSHSCTFKYVVYKHTLDNIHRIRMMRVTH